MINKTIWQKVDVSRIENENEKFNENQLIINHIKSRYDRFDGISKNEFKEHIHYMYKIINPFYDIYNNSILNIFKKNFQNYTNAYYRYLLKVKFPLITPDEKFISIFLNKNNAKCPKCFNQCLTFSDCEVKCLICDFYYSYKNCYGYCFDTTTSMEDLFKFDLRKHSLLTSNYLLRLYLLAKNYAYTYDLVFDFQLFCTSIAEFDHLAFQLFTKSKKIKTFFCLRSKPNFSVINNFDEFLFFQKEKFKNTEEMINKINKRYKNLTYSIIDFNDPVFFNNTRSCRNEDWRTEISLSCREMYNEFLNYFNKKRDFKKAPNNNKLEKYIVTTNIRCEHLLINRKMVDHNLLIFLLGGTDYYFISWNNKKIDIRFPKKGVFWTLIEEIDTVKNIYRLDEEFFRDEYVIGLEEYTKPTLFYRYAIKKINDYFTKISKNIGKLISKIHLNAVKRIS